MWANFHRFLTFHRLILWHDFVDLLEWLMNWYSLTQFVQDVNLWVRGTHEIQENWSTTNSYDFTICNSLDFYTSLYHNLFHIEHLSYPVLSAAPWFGGAGFGSSYFGSWNPRGCHFLWLKWALFSGIKISFKACPTLPINVNSLII